MITGWIAKLIMLFTVHVHIYSCTHAHTHVHLYGVTCIRKYIDGVSYFTPANGANDPC